MAKKKSKRDVSDRLMKVDRATHDAVRPFRDTLPVKALSWFSELGDQPQMVALSGGVLLAGAVRGDRRMLRAGVRMIAAHFAATAAKNAMKHRIDRARPRSALTAEDHKPRPGRSEAKEDTSFPSGHSAGAIAVARAFSREYPEHETAALAAAGLIAIAQIPRCAHFPTDVGAGLAVGIAAEAGTNLLFPAARVPAAQDGRFSRESREAAENEPFRSAIPLDR